MWKNLLFYSLIVPVVCSCDLMFRHPDTHVEAVVVDSFYAFDSAQINNSIKKDKTLQADTAIINPGEIVDTKNVHPDEVVNFAESLIGTPYCYGSTNPEKGFDCSGFITYVFHHFQISVPRSSIDFTHVGKEMPVSDAKRGDLILFTGTNPSEKFVGHMGIVVSNTADSLEFIHSTSGKTYGVTITPLNDYYKGRLVKVIRVFRE